MFFASYCISLTSWFDAQTHKSKPTYLHAIYDRFSHSHFTETLLLIPIEDHGIQVTFRNKFKRVRFPVLLKVVTYYQRSNYFGLLLTSLKFLPDISMTRFARGHNRRESAAAFFEERELLFQRSAPAFESLTMKDINSYKNYKSRRWRSNLGRIFKGISYYRSRAYGFYLQSRTVSCSWAGIVQFCHGHKFGFKSRADSPSILQKYSVTSAILILQQ